MITRRQQKVANCLEQFIDRAYFPDFVPTQENWEAFFSVESNGRASISADSLQAIKPLLEAKGDYELQIRMIYTECAEWWAKGWGWGNPLYAAIDEAMKEPALAVYVDALEKIWETFKADSVAAVANYTGFTQEEKNKYLKQKAA